MSVALAVEVGIEVGNGVAAAVVTGTAMGADVARASHATTNRMTATASPGASRPLHICVIEKPTHKLPSY